MKNAKKQPGSRRFGFYLRLAWQGICKNGRVYVPYIVTCVGMVMMYYIVSALSLSQNVADMRGGGDIQMLLGLGRNVIGFFALLFLVYTNSFLLRQRKKEFGLYNILGMSKLNLARVLLWETALVAGIAIIGGLGLGVLFAKLAELILTRLLGEGVRFQFDLAPEAMGLSCVVFGLIFGLLLLNSLRQVQLSRPVELLRAPNFGEKPPKANWVVALLGLLLLGAAYGMAVSIKDPLAALVLFFVAVIMVIVATYLLFMAGSVALCRLLQKNRAYYYQTRHFVPTANMLFRMRRNGAGLASICILSTMVLVMLSTTLCLFWGKEASLANMYPQDIIVRSVDEGNREVYLAPMREVLERRQVKPANLQNYRYFTATGLLDQAVLRFDNHFENWEQEVQSGRLRQFFFIPLADYLAMTGEELELNEDEVFVCQGSRAYDFNELTLPAAGSESGKVYQVKEVLPQFFGSRMANDMTSLYQFVIMPSAEAIEPIMEKAAEVYKYDRGALRLSWYWAFDLPDMEPQEQVALCNELREVRNEITAAHAQEMEENKFYGATVESIEEERDSYYSVFGGLLFLAVLLAIVFICGAVLIMYYKQLNEGYEDQANFGILRKVGMTDQEIRRGINWQTLILFFAPMALAGVHLAFAFNMLSKLLLLFGLSDMGLLVAICAGCYLVFVLCYVGLYWLTSRSYYRIVTSSGCNRSRLLD